MKLALFLTLFSLSLAFHANAQCWRKVVTGTAFTLAIENDGSLWSWGSNLLGSVGVDTFNHTLTKPTPTQLLPGTQWKELAAGFSHGLAIRTDGTLWGWGFNLHGQVGTGNTVNQFAPVQIGLDTNWQQIAAGVGHSLAIKTDGTLWAWGWNESGQLGQGSNSFETLPIQVGVANNWKQVTGGLGEFTLAVQQNGTLWAWGDNTFSELGDGSLSNQTVPLQIGTDSNWQQVAAGYYHSVGIKKDGTLWSWGGNTKGQLGNGTHAFGITPAQVGTDTDWKQVETGFEHTVALKTNGTLWAWGWNEEGQLGDGTVQEQDIPEQIGTDTIWRQVDAGYGHTAAIKKGSTLWLWGHNYYGQLGDSTITFINTPFELQCPLSGTQDLSYPGFQFQIFPNPAQHSMVIQLPESGLKDLTLEIRNALGVLVYRRIDFSHEAEIDVSPFVRGTYFIQVSNQAGKSTKKFIKI